MNAPAEYIHFADPYTSIEEVEEAIGGFWDATTLQKIADCPRKFETRVVENLEFDGPPSAPMVAGIAVHAGLEYYYSLPDAVRTTQWAEDKSIEVMQAEWESFGLNRTQMDPKYVHLTEAHLTRVMKKYFRTWNVEQIDIYEPVEVSLDDIDLSDVIAGHFLLNDNGQIILGESKLVMRFDVDGEDFYLSGKPDLPVRDQLNRVYAMDHKTTGGNLGDWHKANFEVSNQLRGYMAMLRSLLGVTPSGAIINAMYVGAYPKNMEKSTRTFFDRYVFDFSEGHIDEALRNQLAWKRAIEHFEETGYWPQGCGYGGCDMPALCKIDPVEREHEKKLYYRQSTRHFWDL